MGTLLTPVELEEETIALSYPQEANLVVSPLLEEAIVVECLQTGLSRAELLPHLLNQFHAKKRPAQGIYAETIVLALAGYSDKRTLIPLLASLPYLPSDKKQAILPALAEQLWLIEPEDTLILHKKYRDNLRREIQKATTEHTMQTDITSEEADFLVAGMKALATIGDAKSKRLLHRWENLSTYTPNRATVRSAAKECLRLLEERLIQREQDRSPNTLHRDLADNIAKMERGRAVALLGEQIQSQVVASRRVVRKFKWIRIGLIMLLVGSLILVLWNGFKSEDLSVLIMLMLTLNPFMDILFQSRHKRENPLITAGGTSAFLRTLTTALIPFAEKRTLSVLLDGLECLGFSSLTEVQNLIAIVTNLLQKLEPGDEQYLTEENREFLRQVIRYYPTNNDELPIPSAFVEASQDALHVLQDTDSNSFAKGYIEK
jgi:hypothetical protein